MSNKTWRSELNWKRVALIQAGAHVADGHRGMIHASVSPLTRFHQITATALEVPGARAPGYGCASPTGLS